MSDPKPTTDFDTLSRELADLLDKRVPEGITYALVLSDPATDDYFIAGEGYMQDALETALQELEEQSDAVSEEGEHGTN